MKGIFFSLTTLIFFIAGCAEKEQKKTLFELIPSKKTGIQFVNTVTNSEELNIFKYRNFYNGGGVAIGDINNDGLPDVYFTSNLGDNKLFLNRGNFNFEDITKTAGVKGERVWSTGVVMVDVNNDHLLDIYVCNAGYFKGDDRRNELFINQGNLTFKEEAAKYGLNDTGYPTHAAFFDYDNDGDLDAYILKNSFIPVNTLNYSNKRELKAEDWPVEDFLKGGGAKLLRNDNGKYVDVSEEAGIYGSLIGFGLGITIGDVNDDDLLDIYVSNDFFERDYLYINQGDGTFKEQIKDWMGHISLSSMGADMGDIDNDGKPEIFVTEMLPSDDYRLKTTTSFDNYNVYSFKLQQDFYHQYMHNTLQYNDGKAFKEISWYGGVAASDWSWGALIFDADNDGYKDIYVCNGIYQDVTNQDFINFFASEIIQEMTLTGKKEGMEKIIAMMPSNPQINKMFHNNKNLTFTDAASNWGLDQKTFSNGAAYGDLDNDGDLDLVVSNVNQEALVYRNNASELLGKHYLKLKLSGPSKNTFAIGAKVMIYSNGLNFNHQVIPTRGFQSSVDYAVTLGLGESNKIDSMIIVWPDKSQSIFYNSPVDTTLNIRYDDVEKRIRPKNKVVVKRHIEEVETPFNSHVEDNFVDFYEEGLIIKMLSREGPKMAVGDVNNDGLDDVYICGASGQAGSLYFQKDGSFKFSFVSDFNRDRNFEDTAAEFIDVDNDHDLDLIVGSGGNHRPFRSQWMQTRVYLNDGRGDFIFSQTALPNGGYNTSIILPFDLEGDGDIDLFIGSRSIPGVYGVAPKSFIYQNNGKGNFADVTRQVAPFFERLGLITDAKFIDILGDSQKELLVTGEWMAPMVFELKDGFFRKISTDLDAYPGWWYSIESDDIDHDGDVDFILGNRGENFFFTGSKEAPAKLWVNDFDSNGTIEKIITRSIGGRDMPVMMKKDLTDQVASLKKQNLKHSEYAKKSIQELFSKEVMDKSKILESTWFKSSIVVNNRNGKFEVRPLPDEVQFSCVYAILSIDVNGDSANDILLAGNDSGFLPQFSKLDASFGHVLLNRGKGVFEIEPNESNFIKGDVKQISEIEIKGSKYFIVGVNNEKPRLFKLN